MSETIRQHFVPVCYLANFGIYGNQGRDSKIYFCDVSESRSYDKPQDRSIDKFPVENNFYDIPELEDKKKILEDLFC